MKNKFNLDEWVYLKVKPFNENKIYQISAIKNEEKGVGYILLDCIFIDSYIPEQDLLSVEDALIYVHEKMEQEQDLIEQKFIEFKDLLESKIKEKNLE